MGLNCPPESVHAIFPVNSGQEQKERSSRPQSFLRKIITYAVASGAARNFKRGGIISTFFQAYFFGRTNLKLVEKQLREAIEGSGGMLLRKNFANLLAAMAISVFFE